ncbi:hypothetical protein KKP97_04960 [Methanothermococcus sp. SCGC AD-155-C09]|nr:hypothetical protein [Methanothermococcus sp. SCGC AD-155-C09]
MKTYYAILTLTIFILLNPLATGVMFSNMSNITKNTYFTVPYTNNSTVLNVSPNITSIVDYQGDVINNTPNATKENKKQNISYNNYSISNTSKISHNITNNTLNDTLNINTSNFTILPMNNFTVLNISLNRTPISNYQRDILNNTSNTIEKNKKQNTSYNNHTTPNTSKINSSYLINASKGKHYNATEYLNISIKGYEVIIKTDGEPKVYVDNITLNTMKIRNDTYILSPVVLNKSIDIYAIYSNKTLHKRIFLNYSKEIDEYKDPYLEIHLNKSERSYKVIVKTNGKLQVIYKNLSVRVMYERIGEDRYILYPIILNNTLIVYSHYPNHTIRREILLNISTNKTTNYFNKTLNFKDIISNKDKKVKTIVSYDPSNREIVVKLVGSRKYLFNKGVMNKLKDSIKCHISNDSLPNGVFNNNYDINIISKSITENASLYEFRIPLNKYNGTMKKRLLKKFNIPEGVLNTTIKTVKVNETKLRVEVENKLDNVWYKFSAKANIPKGYRIKEIVGDDGRIIVNNISVDRETGELNGDIMYYIENNTIYFYDDPIYGYNISLVPPAPYNSLAIEIARNNSQHHEGGQISAIIFPYNEGDDDSTIRYHDHAGRSDDYNYGNYIDMDAGSKIAIKYRSSSLWGGFRQFGNGYRSNNPSPLGQYYLDETYREYVYDHETPDGVLESLIITKMYAPWNNRELNITQKIIIRDNYRWFATVYYIKNPTTRTFRNLKFFQGMDWNFNGNHWWDNCSYNSNYDVVYGRDINAPAGAITYGGYKSILQSHEHEVNYYTNMWNAIRSDSLSNSSYFYTDAATALSWYRFILYPGDTWVVPIVWGLGFNYTDMMDQINMGLNQLYDTGVKNINYPYNEEVFNPNVHSIIYVNSTIALYGIVDVENLNVSMEVREVGGTYSYSNYTFISLFVPYEEEKEVIFPLNISNMPHGIYNITVKTNLPNDQNTSNDEKSIIIYINPFSVDPHIQSNTSNPGDSVYYNLTLYNYGSEYYFDINITNSTKSWPTYLYDGGILIGGDNNGDGIWDYILNDSNSNGLPEIYVNGVKNITVVKEIPSTTPLGITDTTTLEFININIYSIRDSATFKTSTPLPPTVHKTFYLHGDSNRTLNTTHPMENSNYTEIGDNEFLSWAQSPRFSDDFILYGNISIGLYLSDPDAFISNDHTVGISLYATDGISVIDIDSKIETLSLSDSVDLYTFNINLDSPITIPRNYYLVLRIGNSQTTNPLRVYHDVNHPSNITVSTTTYVKVQNYYFDKSTYYQGDNATIYVNVTDPIGSYDISGTNITIYYPNGTLLYNGSMYLEDIDSNTPQLWKLYNYSFYLPDPGVYNITITAIESNGVLYTQNCSLLVRYYHNVSIYLRMTPNNYGIYVTPYRPSNNLYVYWHKPNNIEVLNISGDFNESGTYGNTYWFKYYEIDPYITKYISIETNISTVEGVNLGG